MYAWPSRQLPARATSVALGDSQAVRTHVRYLAHPGDAEPVARGHDLVAAPTVEYCCRFPVGRLARTSHIIA